MNGKSIISTFTLFVVVTLPTVGLLGGNLWPNGWESYQAFRPVAFLPSRLELIFIINHLHVHDHHFDVVLPPHLNGTSERAHSTSSSSASSSSSTSYRSTALLTWNSLDTTSWNSSWRSRVLTHAHPVVYTGMFEMNGIVYAIGETRLTGPSGGKPKRIGKIYRYYVTEDDERDLRETDQSVADFFGCPRRKSDQRQLLQVLPVTTSTSSAPKTTSTTSTTTTTTSTTTSTTQKPPTPVDLENRDDDGLANKIPPLASPPTSESGGNRLKSANVFLSSPSDTSSNQIYSSVFLRNSKAKILPIGANVSHHHLLTPGTTAPGVTLRESDSILLTIFIGIVISACVATIILAFLTITGRKKIPPRFEGARIERTIPKPTIIGLDYHPRKSSSASSTHINLMTRYDSMNSINAIYSQISKPNTLGGNGVLMSNHHHYPHSNSHQQQQQIGKKKKSKTKANGNAYHTVDRQLNNGGGPSGGYMATAVSNGGVVPPPPSHAKSIINSSSSPSNNHHTDAFSSGHVNNGGATFQHFDAFE